VLGIMYAGGCLNLGDDYPHVLIVLGFGITGSLTNVIIKLSIYAESQQDIWREKGKIGHPVDVVGLFGSAEFLIYYGCGVFFTALLDDPRPMLAGCWAVAIMSHVSLLQRVRFACKRYRFVDPGFRRGRPGRGGIIDGKRARRRAWCRGGTGQRGDRVAVSRCRCSGRSCATTSGQRCSSSSAAS
jgi:hypothetical protein